MRHGVGPAGASTATAASGFRTRWGPTGEAASSRATRRSRIIWSARLASGRSSRRCGSRRQISRLISAALSANLVQAAVAAWLHQAVTSRLMPGSTRRSPRRRPCAATSTLTGREMSRDEQGRAEMCREIVQSCVETSRDEQRCAESVQRHPLQRVVCCEAHTRHPPPALPGPRPASISGRERGSTSTTASAAATSSSATCSQTQCARAATTAAHTRAGGGCLLTTRPRHTSSTRPIGPVNSWDRLPYITTVRSGVPSVLPAWRGTGPRHVHDMSETCP